MANVVVGMDELLAKLGRLKGGVAAGLGSAVMAGAQVLEGKAKISIMTGAHTGRIYTRGKRTHQASAPGQTPATDYGHLVNSIASRLVSASATRAEAEVGPSAEYAEALEVGTARVAARPFMRPAVDENEDAIQKAVSATIERLVKASSN